MYGSTAGDTLTGSDGRNCLTGSEGDDRLAGRGGDDELQGRAGADTMLGGAGDDVLSDTRSDDPPQPDVFSGGDGYIRSVECGGVIDAVARDCHQVSRRPGEPDDPLLCRRDGSRHDRQPRQGVRDLTVGPAIDLGPEGHATFRQGDLPPDRRRRRRVVSGHDQDMDAGSSRQGHRFCDTWPRRIREPDESEHERSVLVDPPGERDDALAVRCQRLDPRAPLLLLRRWPRREVEQGLGRTKEERFEMT